MTGLSPPICRWDIVSESAGSTAEVLERLRTISLNWERPLMVACSEDMVEAV